MTTATSCVPNQADLDVLMNQSQRIREKLQHGKRFFVLFKVFSVLVLQYARTRKLVNEIRKDIINCHTNCDDVSCMRLVRDRIVPIRDMQIEFLEEMPKSVHYYNLIYRPILFLVEECLNMFDDLVEDCEIGSDAEFRNLVKQIAEKF